MKTREQLIEDFKKSNKQRRLQILAKSGFKTEKEYFDFLDKVVSVKKNKDNSVTATLKEGTIGPPGNRKKKKKDMLDYVVAFDTTGSMMSYINAVKDHVRELIPQMFSQDIDLKMKIVAFGDYCDMTNERVFGNAYQESKFTDNQNQLISFIQNAKDTSGGDTDEFYEVVIKKIVEETPWREGAKKAVLFIADCDPHQIGYNYYGKVQNAQIDWKKEAQKAKQKGIGFDTLSIHGDVHPWYKELSEITGGVYMPFKSSNKMAEVVAASAYVRGSKKSRTAFSVSMSAAMSSGDEELIGTYKSLGTLLDKK